MKAYLIGVIGALGALGALGACGSVVGNSGVDADTAVTLTVVKAGTGVGTVTSAPAGIDCGAQCSGTFAQSTSITLTAAADGSSIFKGWSGGGCTGATTCTVDLVVATTVTATFGPSMVALSVAKTGSGTGTVTSAPAGITCGATCTATFGADTTVTLTAVPDAGFSFSGWSGGGCAGTYPCTIKLSDIESVTATLGVPTLYLIEDNVPVANQGTLQKITNLAAPVITNVGALGVGYAFGDCAYDSTNQKLYMVDGRGAKSLYTLDMTTGAATLVGAHGITDMFALAYDSSTDTLYANGYSGTVYTLYTLDKTTGAATPIGQTNSMDGLAYDSKRNLLLQVASGSVAVIDRANGALSPLAGTILTNDLGGTYDAGNDRLWVANYDGGVSNYNPATSLGASNLLTGQGAHTCIAYVP